MHRYVFVQMLSQFVIPLDFRSQFGIIKVLAGQKLAFGLIDFGEKPDFRFQMAFIIVQRPIVALGFDSVGVQLENRPLIRGFLGRLGFGAGDGHQTAKVAVGLIDPVVFAVNGNFSKVKIGQFLVPNVPGFFRGLEIISDDVVKQFESVGALPANQEIDHYADADFVLKDISAFALAAFSAGAGVAFQVDGP